jgi:hypothetical protein
MRAAIRYGLGPRLEDGDPQPIARREYRRGGADRAGADNGYID